MTLPLAARNMPISPIIVIGSPRSGTSVIARLLQERCGILMDEGPIRKDKHNPKGFYEDPKLIAISAIAIKRWQHGKAHVDKVDPVWAIAFAKWVGYRTFKYGGSGWGFKDPRMIGFISWWKQFFFNPIYIYCKRDKKLIVKSQVKKLGISKKDARNGVEAYGKLITNNLCDSKLHEFDLTLYQEEDVLTERLKRIVENGSSTDG